MFVHRSREITVDLDYGIMAINRSISSTIPRDGARAHFRVESIGELLGCDGALQKETRIAMESLSSVRTVSQFSVIV